jgi:RimJ/RimL family protein N-acetyltransferase
MEFELRGDWAYLEWIAVAPDMQGRGIAGRLVELCCTTLFARGARRIVTDVESTNTASAAMMSRHGFEPATTITLLVRPDPDDHEPAAEDGAPGLSPASKRALARTGRLRR